LENKDKYFFLGFALGFVIPFLESSIKSAADPNLISIFGKMLVLTGSIWQYIFLYLVALFTFILYFEKLETKPDANAQEDDRFDFKPEKQVELTKEKLCFLFWCW